MRLDVSLVERGLAKSRTLAARLIEGGYVTVNGAPAKKASYFVDEADEIAVLQSELVRYVSRGGLKLEAALSAFSVSPNGLVCFDFGASTGGFCDCLLQHGAACVYAVDVGKSQLCESLRGDSRIVSLEETDARTVTLEKACDLGVMDVSFISQSLLYPAARRNLVPGGDLITLFKPQFEVGRESVAKGGIVKDARARERAFAALTARAAECSLRLIDRTASPILGGDGNYEELLLFKRCEDV